MPPKGVWVVQEFSHTFINPLMQSVASRRDASIGSKSITPKPLNSHLVEMHLMNEYTHLYEMRTETGVGSPSYQ